MTGTSSRCNYSKCSTNNNNQASNNLLGCSRCKSAKYCSTDCQKKDWVFHKF
ncbi:MAG: zinc finger MYND domain-containing protein, partial [Desulfobacteraceae bacterium]|nr:zinc finger MYND domain-containing protein [Desulfobacteraceae bacterium]